MKAVIPTGGRGTRMQPMSLYTNKHFIPVANKPLIFYPIETIAESGIKEVAITYSPESYELAKNFLGDGSRWGLKFTYILQDKPMGLGHIVKLCEDFVGNDSFVFHLGDNIFTKGIKKEVEVFEKEKPNGMVLMVEHPENSRMGVPYFDKKGSLVKYVEKPANPPHKFAIPGLYFFDSNVFKCFSGNDSIKLSERGEYEISAVYQWLIDHKYKVNVKEYKDMWLDPGKFDDWIDSNQYLLDKNVKGKVSSKIDDSSIIKNRVDIGINCKIENSELRGPLSISDNTTIIDSYIGPYTALGSGCEIRDSKMENCILMEEVKITNVRQEIDNSLIGPRSEISGNSGHRKSIEFFVGEKTTIKL